MFNIGDKIRGKVTGTVYEVLAVGSEMYFVRCPHGSEALIAIGVDCWELVPKTVVRYLNLYPSGNFTKYNTRNAADANTSIDRVSCIRIELIEGQFDD